MVPLKHYCSKFVIIGSSLLLMMIIIAGCLLYLFSPRSVAAASVNNGRPHIIYILADDLGWNDVSYHGSPQIPTPNIDALAASGITFLRHYVAPQCSPSRGSLMSGRYPSNTGLEHFVLRAGQANGLPLNFTIMPQYMKNLGYATHLVGKWHIGSYKKEFTPLYRGFDSFFGYWNGAVDYYDHTHLSGEGLWGLDFHDGMKAVRHLHGKYAPEIFTQKAVEIIKNHNQSQPLFLLLCQITPHTGNTYQRLQATTENVIKFRYISDEKRRTYAGVVAALDESVGKLFATLHSEGMLNNSIIVFMSDNGAAVEGQSGGHGSNWPLRGAKLGLFEGGVRVPALIWSPTLGLKQPQISKGLLHISDWLPTLYAAAGGDVKDLEDIDGISMWEHILGTTPSPRTEILLNVDPYAGMASLIKDDYKLVNGTYPSSTDMRNRWYGPSGRDYNITNMDAWVWRRGSIVKQILQDNGNWLIKVPNMWRNNTVVTCGYSRPPDNGHCDPTVFPCLFNITEDPCEYHNLATQRPQVVQEMMDRITALSARFVKPMSLTVDPTADPRCHDFLYVPWLDEEYKHASMLCKLAYNFSTGKKL